MSQLLQDLNKINALIQEGKEHYETSLHFKDKSVAQSEYLSKARIKTADGLYLLEQLIEQEQKQE